MNVKRTQQFVYFQSKAKHYDNLYHAKPSISSIRYSLPSPRPRPSTLMKTYDQMRNNQNLVNNILSIRHSNKSRVEAQGGYSRYNQPDIGRISKYGTFRETERHRSIQYQNNMLGERILRMKPSIGTIADWNQNFQNVKSRKKIASKVADKKIMSIYSRNQFVPQHYRTFMERDGSTVAIKQKVFQVPKSITNIYSYAENNKPKKNQIKFDLDFKKIIKDASGEININQ